MQRTALAKRFEMQSDPAMRRLPIRNSMADSHSNAAGNDLMLQKLRALAPSLPLPSSR